MTKLLRWLSVGALFLAVWGSLVTELLPIRLSSQLQEVLAPVSSVESRESFPLETLYQPTSTHTHIHLNIKSSLLFFSAARLPVDMLWGERCIVHIVEVQSLSLPVCVCVSC